MCGHCLAGSLTGVVASKSVTEASKEWHASWVQNVVRQFGLYLSWAQESCVDPPLVREDRGGRTSGLPVVPPGAPPGIRVRNG